MTDKFREWEAGGEPGKPEPSRRQPKPSSRPPRRVMPSFSIWHFVDGGVVVEEPKEWDTPHRYQEEPK